jgi:excinuclease ABC subunit B
VQQQYERNDVELAPGRFRVKGDVIEIWAAYDEAPVRVELWGDDVDRIALVDPVTGDVTRELESTTVFPAKHYVTPFEKLQPAIARSSATSPSASPTSSRSASCSSSSACASARTTTSRCCARSGYCNGIENYSRYLDGRGPASRRTRCSTTSRTTSSSSSTSRT